MISCGFTDTFQVWVKMDLQGGKLLWHIPWCFFLQSEKWGHDHLKFLGAFLSVQPHLERTRCCCYCLCDWRKQNFLEKKGTTESNLLTTLSRIWILTVSSTTPSCHNVLCCHCKAEVGMLLPLWIVYFEHVSIVLWVSVFFFFLFLYSASHCLYFMLMINCSKYSCSWTARVQFLSCISFELAMQVQVNLGECTHPRISR